MEEFLKINWNPSVDDLIDENYIDHERMERESAMYKTLRGTFTDPFVNLHEDYSSFVTSELLSQISEENMEQREIAIAKQKENQQKKNESVVDSSIQDQSSVQSGENQGKSEEREYIPGIVKAPAEFSRFSQLNVEQQALSLRVLIKFSASEKPTLTPADNEDLQAYMSLMPIISKEQDEFLELAKTLWNPSKFKIHEEEFIDFQWKKKLKRIDDLPRYYTETENIPLVSGKEISINFHSNCLEMGVLPKIFLPRSTKRTLMLPNTTKICQRFFATEATSGAKNVIFKIPVSEDPNCEQLAELHDNDLVISSGGLNCLALNIDSTVPNSWILPIVVRRIKDKNVVFVDKPLPPTALTVMQKNTWLHKYNIKSHIAHPYHIKAERLNEKNGTQSQDPPDTTIPETTPKATPEETSMSEENENSVKGHSTNSGFVPPAEGHNIFYRLFSIGPSSDPQKDLMKDPMKSKVDKVYKLLVRSKIDGFMEIKDGQQLTMIAPKLEHQMALGAEAVTREEAVKQWMSLTFRPHTTLIRMRLEATTMELVQYEKRTASSINNEIKRLYNLKTEAALTLLYNVADTMTGMKPGRYILRHAVHNGAFASVYKEVNEPGKNVFDLQTLYPENEFPTVQNPPWTSVERVVVTPALKAFNRMPAMFKPSRMPIKKGDSSSQRGKKGKRGRPRGRPKKASSDST